MRKYHEVISGMKRSQKFQPTRVVFSVSHPGLPNNMRSLFLASERYTMEYPLLKRSRLSPIKRLSHHRKLGKLMFIGVLVFMTVILLATIAVLLVFLIQTSSEVKPEINTVKSPQAYQLRNTSHNTREQGYSDIHALPYSDFMSEGGQDQIKCYKKCWPYTAFRFESECLNGYCHCNGEGYNSLTCLPIFRDCTIERNSTNAVAFRHGKMQETFGCYSNDSRVHKEHGDVHVISTMNEWKPRRPIKINVTSAAELMDRPITLVLASYYPLHWYIWTQHGIRLKSILQISTVRVSMSRVNLNGKEISNNHSLTAKRRSLVGYGDDRYSSHTIQLLQTVHKMTGHVTSFSGSKIADFWTLNISRMPDGEEVLSTGHL